MTQVLKKNKLNRSKELVISSPKKSSKLIKNNNSGSKTSKPSKKKTEVETDIDINTVFEIIDSENKRKTNTELKNKKIIEVINDLSHSQDNSTTSIDNTKKTKHNSLKMNEISNSNLSNVDINNMNLSDKISKTVIKTYHEAKQFLKDNNITISTITLDCKLHTLIDVDKFAKNVILKEDEIVSVKFGNRKDSATNRTIVILKSKKKPSNKNFYNQVTILMKPTNNPIRNYINIKVFKNGSLQMTGCKDMDDFNNVTNTLINILKRGKDIKNKKGKLVHINFINNPEKIGIYDVKIRMINSNFKVNYKIDRKKLFKLLRKNHKSSTKDKEIGYVECKYEPTGGHSCVNIKYQYDEKSKPSIFVFQTGAIIITGAKTLDHIIKAYHFINKILNSYYDKIRIPDLDQKIVQQEIAFFFSKKNNLTNNITL